MILLSGIPSESSLRRVHQELNELGLPHVMVNQRSVRELAIDCVVDGGGVTGQLTVRGVDHALEDFTGVFLRLMDDAELPEVRSAPEESPLRRHSRELHEALYRWSEIAAGVVVNRPDAMASNGSKPYQAQLIAAQGLEVPATLVTTDPEEVLQFRERHGRLVYKSVSGARSVVRELRDEDLARLDDIRWCPVQFQEHVGGTDVRVHVVGQEVFATAVRSEASDYRYAMRLLGDAPALSAVELADSLAERCVRLTAALGLEFSGIDLRVTPDDRAVCFEVNPSPAFSYYESHTGQPIAAAVARRLAGMGPAGSVAMPSQAAAARPGGRETKERRPL